MPNSIRNIHVVDDTSYPYIFERDVSVPLQDGGVVRCNIYRPKDSSQTKKYPVVATYGPYGKDIPYKDFHPKSFSELNPEQTTYPEHTAWETPDPNFWTSHGYVVLRADETGAGQSPGVLDPLSAATVDGFYDLIEWASTQPWSTGKVGLLGISYYAATQWQVAARKPKGLAAIVPWEGYTDFYRDVCRHGGILSGPFIRNWYARQVASNQYGLSGKFERNWGPDTIEGDLSERELKDNAISLEKILYQRFQDNPAFRTRSFNLEDVEVPLLSVANLGGIGLHLRGNIQGFIHASSEFKYLRLIVGRHDLPFYYAEEVDIQRSFLDAFLKGDDNKGWSQKGTYPAVDLVLRKGDVGHNNPIGEKNYPRRQENEWPIARTRYTNLYLTPNNELLFARPSFSSPSKLGYRALGTLASPQFLSFITPAFESETEITGHIVAHLNVSADGDRNSTPPSDIDLFVTVRHLSVTGKEILYTGTNGDGISVVRGFLRVSLRKTNPEHPRHRPWLPHRDYFSTDILPVIPNEVYAVDVELWPTNVVIEKGERLVFEVSSGDTAGASMFVHEDPIDRSEDVFKGTNFVHFGPQYPNYITIPVIPPMAQSDQ